MGVGSVMKRRAGWVRAKGVSGQLREIREWQQRQGLLRSVRLCFCVHEIVPGWLLTRA